MDRYKRTSETRGPEDVERQLRRPDPTPPELPHHNIMAGGLFEDIRSRRRMKAEKYNIQVYDQLIDVHNQMWNKFAVMLDTRHKAEQKAHQIRIDRDRAKQQAAVLTAEAKAKEAEAAKYQMQIDEHNAAGKRAEDLHQVELKKKQLENAKLELELERMKPRNDGDTNKHGLDPLAREIMRKVNDLANIQKTNDFLKSLLPESAWEDIDILCEERAEEIRRRG